MKKIHNYIMLLAVALAFAGCADDEIVNIREQAQTGDEVKFGLSLERLSRTVYGDEVTGTDENNQVTKSFPIYWVDGDKVLIFSPHCLEGRQGAEYKVVLPDEGNAYYAKDLVKTSANGVQWGDAETATFYSLYPSGLYGLSDDGKVAKGIFINYNQNILVDGTNIKSDMEDCLMYAQTTAKKGYVVNLQYNPITTVFMLTLNADAADANAAENFVIQSVSIKSADEKTYIAGSFGINVGDGTVAEWGDNKDNIVTATIKDKATGGYFTLQKGNSIQIPLFMAPVSGLNTNGWKIEVKTLVDGVPQTFIKTLDSRNVQAGKIHKVILPKLSIKKEEVKVWDPATWMVNIPRNVYLSELSIPGTWNSANPDFQDETSIDNQYALGVRSFHFDTRWDRVNTGGLLNPKYSYTLRVAAGNADWTLSTTNKYESDASPAFEDLLASLISKVENNTEEYMVLICSFAQNSGDGTGSYGNWYQEISGICNKYDKVYDAKKLSPNTLVGDVLGSVIVIVNLPDNISNTTVLPSNSKCLFTNLPSELSPNHFNGTDDNHDLLWIYESSSSAKDCEIEIYNNQAQITSSKIVNNINVGYTTSSRGYAPSVAERTAVLEKIVAWSKGNYGTDNYQHDTWIYLGLGGYQSSANDAETVSGSYAAIENIYNPWINAKVEEMGTTVNNVKIPFYPVGIVLMNNKKGRNYTDSSDADLKYGFSTVVKNILLLNSKYQLQYDPSKTEDYNPNLLPASEYNTVMLNGGAVFQ